MVDHSGRFGPVVCVFFFWKKASYLIVRGEEQGVTAPFFSRDEAERSASLLVLRWTDSNCTITSRCVTITAAGLVAAAVVGHTANVAENFSHGVSLIVTSITSILLFQFRSDPVFWWGGTLPVCPRADADSGVALVRTL